MARRFEFAPVPMPSRMLEETTLLSPYCNRRTISICDIVKEIACTLTRTDVVAVLDALNRSMVD